MLIKFWGTRGSIPTPGRQTEKFGGNTSCVEVRVGGKMLIFDCGSGLRDLGQSLMREFGRSGVEAHIFLSHTHWDHIQGFPFFVPAFSPGNTFYVYGSASKSMGIGELMSGQMQPEYFPARIDDMGSNIHFRSFKEKVDLGRVKLDIAALYHPGGCHGFAMSSEGKKVVYATDNELNLGMRYRNDKRPELGWKDPALTLDPHILPFYEGADLLIADCQYTDEEYPQKVNWGHSSMSAVAEVAIRAQVQRLAIFHHDPMHSDRAVDDLVLRAQRYLLARGSRIDCFGAREGMVLKV